VADRLRERRLAVDKVFGGTKTKAERHDWIMHNLELVQMAHAKDKRPAKSPAA
jgi:nitrate/nitrite transport system ATP-binding protein